jgi:predicted dehydrogenase
MKVALIGLGYWGQKILRNLVSLTGAEAVVAIDLNASRVAAAARLYPGAIFSTDVGAIEGADVAAVIVATPVESHTSLTRMALNSGRHVLVEKPLATNTHDATQLAELADRRGLTLMVGHTFLFSPRVQAVADALDTGQIGRVQYLTTSRLNLGLYRSDINVIWDLAPHDFSIIFHLLKEFPVRVHTSARSSIPDNTVDVAFMNLVFPSGVIASVVISWRAPRKVRTTLLVGDRGMIAYDDTNPDEPVKLYDRGVVVTDSASFGENQLTYRYGNTIAPHVAPLEPLMLELEHFIRCFANGEPCLSDGWFGVEVVRALEAADLSWRGGSTPYVIESPTSAPTR